MSSEVIPRQQRPPVGASPSGGGGGIDPSAYARFYGTPAPAPNLPPRGFLGQTKQERGATGYQPLDQRVETVDPATGARVIRDGSAAFLQSDIDAAGGDVNAIDPSKALSWQGLVNRNIMLARGGRTPTTTLDWTRGTGAMAIGTPPPGAETAPWAGGTNRGAPSTNRIVASGTDRAQPWAGTNRGAPSFAPATPVAGTSAGLNTRQWLASRGYVVGEAAAAGSPDAKRLSWADVAAAAGIQDFQGSQRDPRFPMLQRIFYGHTNNTPEEEQLQSQMLQAFQQHPAFAGGAGAGGFAGLPNLAAGGVIPQAPTAAGQVHQVAGRPVIAGEQQPEAVLPLTVLQSLVSAAAAQGAQAGVAQAGGTGLPRLASGGVVLDPRMFNPGRGPVRQLTGALGGGSGPDAPAPGWEWRPGFGPPDEDPDARPNRKPQPPPQSTSAGDYRGTPPPDLNTLYANPYGEGGSYTPFAGYSPASYTPYQQQAMSPEEQQQLSAITSLARQLEGQGAGLFGVGSQAYNEAIRYYRTLLGGNRAAMTAAVAPTAEMLREQGQAQAQTVGQALGRGGARDATLADISRQTGAGIAELTRGVQPAAAQALSSAGLAGAQVGAGLEQAGGGFYQSALGALTQHRQFEEGLGESSRQFGAGLTEQSRQFGTGLQESSRQFSAQLAEQVRQGNMSWQQAQQALALQGWQSNEQLQQQWATHYESIRQFNEQLRVQREQIAAQRSAGRGQLIGTLGGAVIGGGALLL